MDEVMATVMTGLYPFLPLSRELATPTKRGSSDRPLREGYFRNEERVVIGYICIKILVRMSVVCF